MRCRSRFLLFQGVDLHMMCKLHGSLPPTEAVVDGVLSRNKSKGLETRTFS